LFAHRVDNLFEYLAAEVIYVSVHCRYRVGLYYNLFDLPSCLPYSGTILAQQVIALHTELQRPKPL
jgi:hypothetical protein